MDHNNTRWECSFESTNKDEFNKHCKNISKRVKWRDLIENAKQDKDGLYRCVYYSTDRHHVENHYTKGSNDVILSPSPQQVMRYKNFITGRGYTGRKGKRDDDDDDDNISPEDTAREMKKLKQDSSLLAFFQEQHMDPNANALPDNMKIVELMGNIEKKLELAHEIIQSAVEKLHKQGFIIVSGLKTLKKEGWEKLELPLAIEEELKSQIASSRNFTPWYGMGVPFAWGFPHQVWSGQYNSLGQPIYVPYHQYDGSQETGSQEAVLGMGEVSEKEKEKTEEKETENEPVDSQAESAPTVSLVPPEIKTASQDETK